MTNRMTGRPFAMLAALLLAGAAMAQPALAAPAAAPGSRLVAAPAAMTQEVQFFDRGWDNDDRPRTRRGRDYDRRGYADDRRRYNDDRRGPRYRQDPGAQREYLRDQREAQKRAIRAQREQQKRAVRRGIVPNASGMPPAAGGNSFNSYR